MMIKRPYSFVLTLIAALAAGCAFMGSAFASGTANDFYGIKVRSVQVADDFFLEETAGGRVRYVFNNVSMDQRVNATARLRYSKDFENEGRVKSVHVTVANQTNKPIRSDQTFASFQIVTADGETLDVPLKGIYFDPLTQEIHAGEIGVFYISLGWVDLTTKDIAMIVCSFDMGETIVVLKPRPGLAGERVFVPKRRDVMAKPEKRTSPVNFAKRS